MARKKKSSDNVDTPVVGEIIDIRPVEEKQPDEPPQLYLSESEVLKIRLFEEETIASDATVKLLIYQKEAYLAKIDPEKKLSKLMKEIQSAAKKNADAKAKAIELKNSIESRLNIKLDEYSYNEETGQLQKPEQ
jgi:hypothetical protein